VQPGRSRGSYHSTVISVRFVYHSPGCDRRHFVDGADVSVVLSRLPPELWARLRAVHFNDWWRCGRQGYTNIRSGEIALCALPPRVSLARALEHYRGRGGVTPGHFGAARGRQWPQVAVRRFMLYEVLLHEIGHLQVVDPSAGPRRQFARERVAEGFANVWRRRLWSHAFDHPDPAHNPPSREELEFFGAGLPQIPEHVT